MASDEGWGTSSQSSWRDAAGSTSGPDLTQQSLVPDFPTLTLSPAALMESAREASKYSEANMYNPLSAPLFGNIFDHSFSLGHSRETDSAAEKVLFGEQGPARIQAPGLLLIVQIICSNMRHLKHPQLKIAALLLLVRIGLYCPDDIILQRILPFLVLALEDPCAMVRATSVRAVRSLLTIVNTFTSLESNIFQYYVFPALGLIARDTESVVRIAFAESIGSFAETSKRFLDRAHVMLLKKSLSESDSQIAFDPTRTQAGGMHAMLTALTGISLEGKGKGYSGPYAAPLPVFVDGSYDLKLGYLHEHVSRWIRDLVLDTGAVDARRGSGLASYSSIVKRVLLVDIVRLCVFFGHEATMDLLLTQLLTFLNDQDWELRYAFCAKIPAVCVFVGPTVTSECILPCIENAVYDVEEMVVCRALACLSALVQLRLLSPSVAVDVFKKSSPLLLHPSAVIRKEIIKLTAVTADLVGTVDSYVFLLPLIRTALNYDLVGAEINEFSISKALKSPLTRWVYRQALHVRLNSSGTSTATSTPMHVSMSMIDSNSRLDLQGKRPSLVQGSAVSSGSVDSTNPLPPALLSPTASFYIPPPTHNHIQNPIPTSSSSPMSASITSPVILPIVAGASTGISVTAVPTASVISVVLPNSSASSPTSIPIAAPLALSQTLEEQDGLQFMATYIEESAREISTKTIQWKNGLTSGASSAAGVAATLKRNLSVAGGKGKEVPARYQRVASKTMSELGGAPGSRAGLFSTNLEGLLEVPSAVLPEPYYLLVPNQKVNKITRSVHDEKRLATMRLENVDANWLKSTYAVSASQSDAARLKAETDRMDGQSLNTDAALNGGGSSTDDMAASSQGRSRFKSTSGLPNSVSGSDPLMTALRLKALDVPPLNPDFGTLMQPNGASFSEYVEGLDNSTSYSGASISGGASESNQRHLWRPRENVLVTNLLEHTAAVSRLAVARDQTFFASASHDKTVKIWQINSFERSSFPKSALTYVAHKSKVLDCCLLDNTHSVASCAENGTIHVWRVDMGLRNPNLNRMNAFGSQASSTSSGASGAPSSGGGASGGAVNGDAAVEQPVGLSVIDFSVVRRVDPGEGPVLALHHFNGDAASVLTYITQKGFIHGWDMRASKESFVFPVRPELGAATCLAVSPDRNWIVAGTTKGYIGLWDIRFNIMCKLWRHSAGSAIQRLARCKSIPRSHRHVMQPTEGAYLFVASGSNETTVWGTY